MAGNRGGGRRNRPEVQGARQALDALKVEVANELGIPNYDQIDKADLPSRVNGKVGGLMVRKMIKFAEQAMRDGGAAGVSNVAAEAAVRPEDRQDVANSLAIAQMYAQAIPQGTVAPMAPLDLSDGGARVTAQNAQQAVANLSIPPAAAIQQARAENMTAAQQKANQQAAAGIVQ